MTKLNKLAAVFLAAAFAFAGALPAGAVTVADTPAPDRIYYRETAGEAFSGEFAMDSEITKVEAGEDPAFTLSFEGSALIFDGLTHSVEQAVRIVCGEEALDKTLKLAVYDLVDIAPAKSSLILTVKNSRTLKPVPNAGYTLYRGTQAVRRGLVTDRQGQLTASGLEPGEYLLRPDSTPEGYKTAPGVKFTVTGLKISGGEKEIRTSDGKKNIAGENEVLIAGKFSPDIVLTAGQDKQIGSVTVEYEDSGEAKSLEYSTLHAAQEELNRRKNSGEILGPVHITYEYAEKSGRSYTQYLTEKEPEPTPPVNQGNTVTKPTPTAAPTPKATSTAAPTAAPKPTAVPTPASVPDGQLTIACTADKPGQAFSFEVSGTKLEGGKFRQDYKTDTDGKIAASLPAGKYTVTPKSAKGFDPPEPQTIELIGGGSAYLTFSFVANQRDLALTVVDDDGQPVPGVTVGLFEHGETPLPKVKKNTESSADISAALVQIKEQKAADEKLADPYTKANALYVGKTGEDGTALIQNVPVSGFAAVPIELPDGYSAEKIATEITAGLEDKFTVDCKYVAVDISVWSSNTNSPVVGAELTLMDRDGEKLTEWVSEETAHRLIRVPKGEYRLAIRQGRLDDTVAFEVGGDKSLQEVRAETYLPGEVEESSQISTEADALPAFWPYAVCGAAFSAGAAAIFLWARRFRRRSGGHR